MKEKKYNSFKMLESNEEVPISLKEKVMNDIRLAYLYTSRMGMTITKILNNDDGMDQKSQE